jgi:hypothetical protein
LAVLFEKGQKPQFCEKSSFVRKTLFRKSLSIKHRFETRLSTFGRF